MKTPPFHRPWMVSSLALFTVACATLASRLGPPSGDRIIMPHARHTQAGVGCEVCHEAVATSTSLEQNLLPPMAKCGECHDIEDPAGCGMCHTKPEAPASAARVEQHLKFPHALHLQDPQIEGCERCHPALSEPGPVAQKPARSCAPGPSMAVCTDCHTHAQDYAAGRCAECHQDFGRYPLRPLTDFSHRANYTRQHSLDARAAGQACATCHEQTFCTDCHAAQTVPVKPELKFPERVDQLFIHRNDYSSRHSIEARAEPVYCQRCHGSSFCQACHLTHGLTPQGEGTLNPHPPGYASGLGPGTHAAEARSNIVRCAACHDQGPSSNCVECHQVGAIGGNPHPSSWLNRHSIDELNSNSMCLACHR